MTTIVDRAKKIGIMMTLGLMLCACKNDHRSNNGISLPTYPQPNEQKPIYDDQADKSATELIEHLETNADNSNVVLSNDRIDEEMPRELTIDGFELIQIEPFQSKSTHQSLVLTNRYDTSRYILRFNLHNSEFNPEDLELFVQLGDKQSSGVFSITTIDKTNPNGKRIQTGNIPISKQDANYEAEFFITFNGKNLGVPDVQEANIELNLRNKKSGQVVPITEYFPSLIRGAAVDSIPLYGNEISVDTDSENHPIYSQSDTYNKWYSNKKFDMQPFVLKYVLDHRIFYLIIQRVAPYYHASWIIDYAPKDLTHYKSNQNAEGSFTVEYQYDEEQAAQYSNAISKNKLLSDQTLNIIGKENMVATFKIINSYSSNQDRNNTKTFIVSMLLDYDHYDEFGKGMRSAVREFSDNKKILYSSDLIQYIENHSLRKLWLQATAAFESAVAVGGFDFFWQLKLSKSNCSMDTTINYMTPKEFEDSMESENQKCPKLTG